MDKKKLQAMAFKALKEAVHEVVEEHRRSGRPLWVWRDGKVMKISASEVSRRKSKKKNM